MIKIVTGNLMEAKEDVIAHQVNCRGVMGSGVAKQIREVFPFAYTLYRQKCVHYLSHPHLLLGSCQMVYTTRKNGEKVLIANLFAQDNLGRHGAFTDEEAFRRSLQELAFALKDSKTSIAMPYKIGCGLGGGDWETIYKIIEEELTDFDVTLYKLE